MELLIEKLEILGAITKPASDQEIVQSESKLSIKFSDEYRNFLSKVGIIICGSCEIYGLGVPENYHLNINNIIDYFISLGVNLPKNSIPLLEIGDGIYYLYDNEGRAVIVWNSSTNSIDEVLNIDLEAFLIKELG